MTVKEVRPQEWKKFFSLIKKTKKDSVELAESILGEGEFRNERGTLLDGRAEAFLIAEYARRNNG
jgi:hypothetical protein